jgi:hypothetical protein
MDRIKYILFLIFLGTLLISGCENSVNINDKSSDKTNQTISAISDTIYFFIYQDYGVCDTVCVGQSVILLTGVSCYGVCSPFQYTTEADSLWNGSMWLPSEGVFLSYHTTGKYIFDVQTACLSYLITGDGTIQLNLSCHTTYNLTTQ